LDGIELNFVKKKWGGQMGLLATNKRCCSQCDGRFREGEIVVYVIEQKRTICGRCSLLIKESTLEARIFDPN
jgi:hypothetical protein